MLIFEVIDLFIYNRRNGLAGSKGKARPNTLTAYKYVLRSFGQFMEEKGKTSYEEITVADIRAFVEHLNRLSESGTWSRSRYLLTIKVVKAMFKFIEEDEDCVEAGLKSFRKKMPVAGAFPRRDNIPSPQDLKAWKRSFNTSNMTGLRQWMVFCTLLETGMRREELALIEVRHLQLENKTVYIPDGKTGSRTVVITDSLARIITMYLKKRSRTKCAEGKFLLSTTKSPVPTGASITKFFSRLRKLHGLPYITPHTMRHAFCTYYIRNGGSVERLRNVTGHKTYTAMLHYLHLAKVGGTEQKEEIEKVSPLKMLDSR